ncbi:MAG: hypothetical protein D6814_17960 [Calditrichaeota bacterium]|nr:MAG: hypothetical protein D6814_17960 [Calditrichota bacterium]
MNFKQAHPFAQAQPPAPANNGHAAALIKTPGRLPLEKAGTESQPRFQYKPLNPSRWSTLALWRENSMGMIYRAFFILAVIMTLGMPILLWQDNARLAAYRAVPEMTAKEAPPAKPWLTSTRQHSLAGLANRRFFKQAKQPKPASPAAPIPGSEVSDLQERYMLQGILMGEKPQAIIQDKISGTSLFLSPGEILGDFKIKQILPDRVMLTREGQMFELRM